MANPPSAGLIFYDEEAAEVSARKIIDSCDIVYPGHDRAFAVQGGTFKYIHPQSVIITNVPRDEDGSTLHYSVDKSTRPFEVTVFPSGKAKAK